MGEVIEKREDFEDIVREIEKIVRKVAEDESIDDEIVIVSVTANLPRENPTIPAAAVVWAQEVVVVVRERVVARVVRVLVIQRVVEAEAEKKREEVVEEEKVEENHQEENTITMEKKIPNNNNTI